MERGDCSKLHMKDVSELETDNRRRSYEPERVLASNLNEFESLRRRPYIYAVHLDNFIVAMGAAVRESEQLPEDQGKLVVEWAGQHREILLSA